MKDIVSEICLYVQKAMEGASNELFVQGSQSDQPQQYMSIE